jgi:hypothetical protein
MSEELDQGDNTAEDEGMSVEDAVEAARAVEAEEPAPEPEADAAEGETTGGQDEAEDTPEVPAPTPETGQGSTDKSTDEAEESDPLLSALPEDLHGELKKLRDMQANYNARDAAFQKEHQAYLQAQEDLKAYREVAEDPVKLRDEAKAAREYSEKINQIPPWHSHHPHHQDFMGLVQRGRDVGRRIQEIQNDPDYSDERKAREINAEMAKVSDDERQHIQNYQRAVEDWNLNPMGNTMAAIDQAVQALPAMVEDIIAQVRQREAAAAEVHALAENTEDFDKYAPGMKDVLVAQREGREFDVAKQWLELKQANEALEARVAELTGNVGKAAESVAHAEALVQASQSRAKRTPAASAAGASAAMGAEELSEALAKGNLAQIVAAATEGTSS